MHVQQDYTKKHDIQKITQNSNNDDNDIIVDKMIIKQNRHELRQLKE